MPILIAKRVTTLNLLTSLPGGMGMEMQNSFSAALLCTNQLERSSPPRLKPRVTCRSDQAARIDSSLMEAGLERIFRQLHELSVFS
jgi:hypothetical protein